MIAWLALDDITTDNSTGSRPEYTLLAACGAWCLLLAHDLLKQGYRRLGTTSMLAVASAVWVASDGLGHKRDGGWSVFWPEYTVMLVAWLWFLALAVVLVALGRRVMPAGDTTGLGKMSRGLTTAGALAVATFVALYFPNRDDTGGALFGAAFAFCASVIGLAAVGRVRPLARRPLKEQGRLMALSLIIGSALRLANLVANYSVASLDAPTHARPPGS